MVSLYLPKYTNSFPELIIRENVGGYFAEGAVGCHNLYLTHAILVQDCPQSLKNNKSRLLIRQ